MMAVNLRKIEGNWDAGYALDKHIVSSVYTGDNEAGYPTFDTTRTAIGEAVFQLKYRQDWSKAGGLASAVAKSVVPLLGNIVLIVPMPASTPRSRQPVTEVALELAKRHRQLELAPSSEGQFWSTEAAPHVTMLRWRGCRRTEVTEIRFGKR